MGDENKPPKFDPEKLLGTTSVRQYHFANGRERFLLLTETDAKDTHPHSGERGLERAPPAGRIACQGDDPQEGGIVIDWFFDACH